MLNSVRIFLVLSFLLVLGQAWAQRDKKRRPDASSLSARLSAAESFFTEGEKFFILEDYSKALLYFLRASELNPDNATVYYKLAEVLSKSNKDEDLKRSIASIEHALKLEKKNQHFYLLAASIYNSQGQFTKAASVLEAMLKEVPGTEEHLFELAAVYLFDKKDDEALKIYNRAEEALGVSEASSLQKQRIY